MSSMDYAQQVAACVSAKRLEERLATLASFGDTGDGGVNRQVFSIEDRAARECLVNMAEELGLAVHTDPIGNQFFRLTPHGVSDTAPAWLMGSHLDSQPTGGRFDGVLGVVASLEVMTALREAGISLSHPIEAVSWSNEEGSRFAPGCMGSMVYTGRARMEDFQWAQDVEGKKLMDELFATLASTRRGRSRAFGTPARGYLELHIEQGPVLEREGLSVGVVDGIQGCRWLGVDIIGEARHAGTTPMDMRADAVREAAQAIVAMHACLEDPEGRLRVTVGRLDVRPGSTNTVAQSVYFTVDLRHPDEQVLADAEARLRRALSEAMCKCRLEIRQLSSHPPTVFDEALRRELQTASERLGLGCRSMMSGAFHDALYMASFCPTAMLFVPSRNGISHHPDEFTSLEDLTAGTRVLAAAMTRLACMKDG